MNFGKNASGDRIGPYWKGRAVCELCGGKLYAYGCRSRLRKSGWRHMSLVDCDTWYEPETEWHRSWKAHFSKNWQEVAMVVEQDRHRADVRCPSGLVLEFQNSQISPEEIEAREVFYGRMLWIVNGESFSDRFMLFSTVSDERMFLRTEKETEWIRAKSKRSEEQEEFKKKLLFLEGKLDRLENSREWDLKRINDLKQSPIAVDAIAEKVLKVGTSNRLRSEVECFSEATTEEEERFKSLLLEWQYLTHEIIAYEEQADLIEKSDRYGNTNYIVVDYNKNYQNNWESMRWIQRQGMASINKFNSRTHFLAFKYKTSSTSLLFNPEQEQARLLQAISLGRDRARALRVSIESMIEVWVASRAIRIRSELEELEEKHRSDGAYALDIINVQGAIRAQQEALDELIRSGEIEEVEHQVAMDKREELINTVFVDILRYRWKHKRAVWNFSEAPMFFDFGDSYLYRRIDMDFVHRITKEKFLEHVFSVQDVPPCPKERPHRMTYEQSRGF